MAGSTVQSDGDVRIGWSWSAKDASGVASTESQSHAKGDPWAALGSSKGGHGLAWSWLAAADGPFRARARATDNAGNVSPWSNGSWFWLRTWQGDGADPEVSWSGTWHAASGSQYSDGKAWRSSAAGARARLSVSASDVALVATVGPDRGRVRVVIDGVLGPVVDLYAPALGYRRVAWAHALSPGTHTIAFVVMSNANSASSGKLVELDAFLAMQP